MSDLTPGSPDRAIANVLAGGVPARCRVSVDLSRPETTGRRAVSFEDCDWVPGIGDLVDAVDLINHQEADAEVVGIDERDCFVRIAIDWATVREVTP